MEYSLLDPFGPGNAQEAQRILAAAGVGVAARFCDSTLDDIMHASDLSIQTNPDLPCGHGQVLGTFLGLDETAHTLGYLEKRYDGVNMAAFEQERDAAEHAIEASCEKYLLRHDPPVAALFSGFAYGDFAARMLKKYLDASITVIGCRNTAGHSPFKTSMACSLSAVQDLIGGDPPDLILGSSFERQACPTAAFVPFTYPLRGKVQAEGPSAHRRPGSRRSDGGCAQCLPGSSARTATLTPSPLSVRFFRKEWTLLISSLSLRAY